MSSLFEECVNKLANDIVVFSMQKTSDTFDVFVKYFPITDWGQIDWHNVGKKISVLSNEEIVKILPRQYLSMPVFILWDEASLPVVQSTLENVLNNIDDVTAVSSDTWLFSPDLGYVIEFFHEREITIGFKI
jgi:hypothetical protein